jgi:hypothetical protein
LALPFGELFLAPVKPTPSLPPFVVLGRSRPIVRTLLGEQVIVVHVHSFALAGEYLKDWPAAPPPGVKGQISRSESAGSLLATSGDAARGGGFASEI